jgi:predicted nucleotidyltransferase
MANGLPTAEIAKLCDEYEVAELALFGSALSEEFVAESDYDFLITFRRDAHVSLWDFVNLREALAELLGRNVDLVCRNAIRNPFFKRQALSKYEVVYEHP